MKIPIDSVVRFRNDKYGTYRGKGISEMSRNELLEMSTQLLNHSFVLAAKVLKNANLKPEESSQRDLGKAWKG